MDEKTFYALCDQYLHFLIDEYGCSVQYSDNRFASGVCFGYVVQYQNDTTAIKLRFEFPDVYLYFYIGQLVNGQLYDDPIIITPHSTLHSYELETLLEVRAPEYQLPPPPSYTGDWNSKYVEEKLSRAAPALRRYADDVLRGDFSVFPALREIIMQRIKKGPCRRDTLPPDINKYVAEKLAELERKMRGKK